MRVNKDLFSTIDAVSVKPKTKAPKFRWSTLYGDLSAMKTEED